MKSIETLEFKRKFIAKVCNVFTNFITEKILSTYDLLAVTIGVGTKYECIWQQYETYYCERLIYGPDERDLTACTGIKNDHEPWVQERLFYISQTSEAGN